MSRGFKTALAVGLFGATVIVLIASVVAPVGYYQDAGREGTAIDTFHLIAGWVAGIAGAIAVAIYIYGFVWVVRNLKGRRRLLWAVSFIFLGPLTVFVWWWRLIRPLPEPT
jgi:hypothetical protein